MRSLLLYASNFFNETTQESKYSNDFLELPLNFSLNHCFEKYKTVMNSYLSLRGWGGGGGGTGGGLRVEGFLLVCLNLCIRNYLYPVPSGYPTAYEKLLYAEEFFEQALHQNRAWVITEQMQTLYSVYGMFHYFRFWRKPLLATPKNVW